MKKELVTLVKVALGRYSFFGKVEEIADKRRHAFNQEAHDVRQEVLSLRKRLEEASEKHPGSPQVEDLGQLLSIAEAKLKARRRKREFWRRRYAWAHARHNHWGSVLKHRRDRLRRWIAQHEGFQPYMANGNPYEKLTAEAKHAIYLDFRDGNYVTSTYEGFSGDGVHSTSSGHYLTNQPDGKARCWDCGAGTRGPMVKAQLREARRAGAFLIEMFGPDNDTNFKNGIKFTLGEGEVLETMHDNHKHTWIRDGAPTP
jgi:hypothetical protein